jgi:hypothetical protein
MASDLNIVLPNPPAYRDRMVFITDNRTGRQCSTCLPQPYLATDALMSTILKLYGPQGEPITGSRFHRIHSMTWTVSFQVGETPTPRMTSGCQIG